MSKTRIKVKAAPALTREQMEALVGDIARLTTFEQKTKAQMDKRITEVRADYEAQLASAEQERAAKAEQVQAWAEANPEAFGQLKSLDLLHGVIGWRSSTALKTVSGWTWSDVLAALKSAPRWTQFVRVKEGVDKAALLANHKELGAEALRFVGVRAATADAFYVDPKLTEVAA